MLWSCACKLWITILKWGRGFWLNFTYFQGTRRSKIVWRKSIVLTKQRRQQISWGSKWEWWPATKVPGWSQTSGGYVVCVTDHSVTKTPSISFPVKRYMVGKLRSPVRHKEMSLMIDLHTVWSKGAISSPLSHFWHLLSYYFVPIWLAGVEGLIPLVSFFWMVDSNFTGRGLSTHSCLIHSLYTSRVSLHPHCPFAIAKWAFLFSFFSIFLFQKSISVYLNSDHLICRF